MSGLGLGCYGDGDGDGDVYVGDDVGVLRKAAVMGWCIEWIQASFLVMDDLMDESLSRRGQDCWYRVDSIGNMAVNDGMILLTHCEFLLLRYLGEETYDYRLAHNILIETIYRTELGQLLDMSTQPLRGPVDISQFTSERHRLIVKYKTAFYSFFAPIALGLVAAGAASKENLAIAEEICVKMGIYFQVQDDYLDCYGDPKVMGKVGTDIQDSKCSWLVCKALERATSQQMEIIEKHYGKDNENDINKIKGVFNEMNLKAVYEAYEETIHKELIEDISKVDTMPKVIFTRLLEKIYKRQK